jgi:protein-L-isoaspartate O-methyltransferase
MNVFFILERRSKKLRLKAVSKVTAGDDETGHMEKGFIHIYARYFNGFMKRSTKILQKILCFHGVHWMATRLGWEELRSRSFDEKFRNGDWKFSDDGSGRLEALVTEYARGGDVLIMGCGGAAILKELKLDAFSSILGIDISNEAIRLANRHAASNVSFQQADMVGFRSAKQFDLILFSESLNYVPFFKRRAFLKRLCDNLKPAGCILVTIAQAKRYASILAMIRKDFKVIQDRKISGSERHLIVFHADNARY